MNLAYALGLIATDGNLSTDGRHFTVSSKDRDLLQTLRECLGLQVSITRLRKSAKCFRIQWGDRQFYTWLLGIGLMPAKSLRLGALNIPDEFLRDFVRGCVDGDGSIVVYIDRHNTFKNEKYVYLRLFVSVVSCSLPFLQWLQAGVARAIGVRGGIYRQKVRAGRATSWVLKYPKKASIRLLRWVYHSPGVPCLSRKFEKARPFLEDPGAAQLPGDSQL